MLGVITAINEDVGYIVSNKPDLILSVIYRVSSVLYLLIILSIFLYLMQKRADCNVSTI